ncbi:hypothetical protein F442_00548 [Phytophthora nicotianae P10297]|uniref:Uncharacterized protein n=3 Tax=Phytophthora nicotianae TaxID=4792 RepID=W2RHE1_PHYN3|nr:hypothetical protein PPTG_00462 [Phytophthora nicotianae INRA-310]ETN23995.1 hypothetical protein PPTG_00462 [Phytophthora nicotianae INRA-310]ETO85831.1 hypothetical protein F444_00551 [Phytophthora nicotianae P1976]ETP54823.1 hypothetical protein F442_00548 [Phytophthora nicotianae P10297]
MVWAELMETNSGRRQWAFDAEAKVCEEIEARFQQQATQQDVQECQGGKTLWKDFVRFKF